MANMDAVLDEFRGYSLQNYPVDKLLKKFNADNYSSCLDKAQKNPELYNALAFVFSIHYLVNNLPKELPDDIRKYVEEKIILQGLPYELNNKELEEGLKKYFDYVLPHRPDGDRDIVYTRIREAGYSHLRFAQEICKKAVDENNWDKIVEKIQLVPAYGNADDIKEMKDFFLTLTQSNFEDSFISLGYSQKFAENLKKRLVTGKNRTAWELLEADIEVEYRSGELYFVMPEEKFFPNEEEEEVKFIFQLADGEEKFCCYEKIDAHNYQRYHIDEDIPVAACRAITRNGKDAFPSFLEGHFVIWDVENQICRTKLNYPAKLPAGKEYVVCPTALFDPQDKVEICNLETQESQSVNLPYQLKGDENTVLVITADQRYEITFSLNTSLLDYDKIISLSPDRIKYRYFSDDKHPFKDVIVSGNDKVTISCDGKEETFCLSEWNIPQDFLYKNCTLLIKNKKFQNIVFFSEKWLKRLVKILEKETYAIGKKVSIPFSQSSVLRFGPGVSNRTLEYKSHPINIEIKRKGVALEIAGLTVYPEKTVRLDMQDFESAKLKYFHDKQHSLAKTQVTIRKNGSFLNYIAAHKVTPPCTKINMLSIQRSYIDWDLFSEPEISVMMFLYSQSHDVKKYNYGVECSSKTAKALLCCEDKTFNDFEIKFILTDYTLDQVIFDQGKISHKISYTLSQEKNRFLYCLPVEKQDGDFVKIDISQKASFEGECKLEMRESLSIENLFTGELANSYGLLTFFVYEKNGRAKRYSPGFFLKNPATISIDNLTPMQKALCSCNTEELNAVFSCPGNQEFIEKVFENAEKIDAAHFFNCFFNKIRNNGRYVASSSFAFRAADYWIPAAFTTDENGNQSQAQRRLQEHWDFELFGYEETRKYLPAISQDELLRKLQKADTKPAMGSLLYSLNGNNVFDDDNLQYKLHSDDLQFESKIIFLTTLFANKYGKKIECGKFHAEAVLLNAAKGPILLNDLIFAIDQLAYRIHQWKKSPCLSEIRLRDKDWTRSYSDDPYYCMEQYFRGELVYWRKMSGKVPAFTVLRNLLLCRIAQYAQKDGINYNI